MEHQVLLVFGVRMSRRSTDPADFFLFFCVCAVIAYAVFSSVPFWIWIAISALVALVVYVFYTLEQKRISKLPPCSNCGKKGTFVLMHTRVDGGPDRRHKHNPVICGACRTPQH